MKIETVKWQWAAPVQSKGVYRDEEFVRTKTKDEALKAIDYLMNKPSGLTYTITVKRDGEFFTYYRRNMPCLGGLVKYADSHGKKDHWMNVYFPRDIYVAFPEGDIIYIACQGSFPKTAYNDFIFSKESPWISAFGSKDTIIFKSNYFILTNMDTDPTVFYHFMRYAQGAYSAYSGYGGGQVKNWNPKAEILLTKSNQGDPRRFASRKPIIISGGLWRQGFGYTRPHCEHIFHTSLPHKFKEFGKLGSYPRATQSNKYFIEIMKKQFGVDISKVDKKLHDALVESWDFFKAKYKDLEEQDSKFRN